ncbi:hypothetical protein BGZ65_003709, partial [Modicella reniformis]
MSGQAIIKKSIDQHFDRLQIEMDRNKQLQKQIVQMQQQMKVNQQLQQQIREGLLKKQEEMIQMQKETLDRLAIIHNRVQAVLPQYYELHEYPIPLLFIVLPKAVGLLHKFKNILDQFRLYFLCECGTHTMSGESKARHEIHLTKHEGYDLEQLT